MVDRDSRSKDIPYSRKEKSLGVLCSNFLSLYNRDSVESIELDAAALQLGVERRRIYDIVNILESIWILQRKGKNRYAWKGFGAIPNALEVLQEQGQKEHFGAYITNALNKNEHRLPFDSKTEQHNGSPGVDKEHRREKSLGLLTRNFIKLFLCSDVNIISLDTAAFALLGSSHDPIAMKTKIRRLYDIANVFSSMNLIEKARDPVTGKPGFKWIGVGRSYEDGSSSAVGIESSKKRAFGTDVTNTIKRSNTNSEGLKLNENMDMGKWWKDKSVCEKNDLSTDQHEKCTSKDFVFGPFAPKIKNTVALEKETNLEIQDVENLSSPYCPQYCNPVISDLFYHYASAWNSWFDEAEKKQKTQSGS
ncbi:E2F transcription factor-like E2FF [Andrographis paniculata]|uniref:E2F transcription factor-like E2FF n=1 Tax=Andrographis paniculata TaxID=175694 RepID=UPI0021E78242|nr:E2F transcription factor-like E2FF [Andrographis paniculata]